MNRHRFDMDTTCRPSIAPSVVWVDTQKCGDDRRFFVDAEEKTPSQAVKALKVASARRLVGKLETAYRKGTLKPVSPTATPSVQEIRVKAK